MPSDYIYWKKGDLANQLNIAGGINNQFKATRIEFFPIFY